MRVCVSVGLGMGWGLGLWSLLSKSQKALLTKWHWRPAPEEVGVHHPAIGEGGAAVLESSRHIGDAARRPLAGAE